MKATTIRRTIGITAAVLWAVALSSLLLHDGDKIAFQLDKWAFLLSLILTPIYAVMLTTHVCQGKHWLIKMAGGIVCVIIGYVCIVLFFVSTRLVSDHRTWSNREYVVYSEYYDFIEPNEIVLYRRQGLVDRKMYRLRFEDMGHKEKVEYTMVDSLDLLIEEVTYSPFFVDDSICHDTTFYRLSDGQRYDQDKNDSLIALTNNHKH